MKSSFILILISLMTIFSYGQNNSQVREYQKDYVTYPYSDANPMPAFGKIYPYFRYEGFTLTPEKKSWKVVELENDFLKIQIFPEIGGKIWSVIDKISGKEMFYGNEVVKFRDVALRGAWTSGGLEFNYGVIGHSPACSFPVDYLTRTNPDGSASCIIGALDLLTRTYWNIEINLPKDKAWFTTRSFWHNRTGASQPYYHWINSAVNTKKDLEFIYPGTHLIDHEGISSSWPMDSVLNKNLSRWEENDFIGAKSYHVLGTHSSYFGAYWKEEDYGVLQYSNRDDKLGKKIWIWALSDEGKIWEELLTDRNGQYAELQSGRLFNQNLVTSSLTPYKQINFMPYGTDSWTEYWFPFRGIGGVSNVTPLGVIHVGEKDHSINIRISPLQTIQDTLKIYDDDQLVYQENAKFQIGQVFESKMNVPDNQKISKIIFGNNVLWSNEDKTLSRPVKTIKDFNWNSAYGKYLRGRDFMGFRLYDKAELFIRESLNLDHNYIPSLVEMSKLYYYHLNYDSAFICAKKALSIDTYDAAANYEYGRSAMKLNQYFDALDGFEVAALTEPYRSAAYTEISKIYRLQNNPAKSLEYAQKSLINNVYNIEGLQMSYLAYLSLQKGKEAEAVANRILEIEPLNHFIRFERYYNNQNKKTLSDFQENIRDEMPVQTYLELGIWYYTLNMIDRSQAVLQLAPENAEVSYWLAFLSSKSANEKQVASLLKKAASQDANFIFPFREESEDVFKWAIQQQSDWQPRYYLALLNRSRNNGDKAYVLLSSINDDVKFAPLYSLRARSTQDVLSQEKDLRIAASLSLESRYTQELTRFYLNHNDNKKALEVIAPFYRKNKNHFPTGLMYTRALLKNKEYTTAEKVLNQIYILPPEGYPDGRLLYRATKLSLAAESLFKGNTADAQKKISEAGVWSRNMGVGKPFEEMIDSRIEDWLEVLIAQKTKDSVKKVEYLKKVAYAEKNKNSMDYLLQALASYQLGEKQHADEMFNSWLSVQKDSTIKDWGNKFYLANKNKEYPFDYEQIMKMIESTAGSEYIRMF
ncbi:MAG: DUF5107 domain-containing protein [Bacteroidales bacterium]